MEQQGRRKWKRHAPRYLRPGSQVLVSAEPDGTVVVRMQEPALTEHGKPSTITDASTHRTDGSASN